MFKLKIFSEIMIVSKIRKRPTTNATVSKKLTRQSNTFSDYVDFGILTEPLFHAWTGYLRILGQLYTSGEKNKK